MSIPPPDLLDPAVLERCAAAGELPDLLARWSAWMASARDPHDELRRILLAALRVDLATIAGDPALLFACVYNRVYWHGSAEAVAFYKHGVHDVAAGAPLRAWAERWRAARSPRGVWARRLRPPEFPLLQALREEYRAALPHGDAPRFSNDGRHIGVGPVAWERATGRRLPADAATDVFGAPPTTNFELDRLPQSWGHARVRDRRSGELVFDVDVDGDSSFGCITEMSDGTGVLVGGWCDDNDGAIARIDAPSGQVRWRTRVGSTTDALLCAADGSLVLACDGAAVHMLAGDSGAVLASVPLAAGALALAPDGAALATVLGDLVRVWDVAALRRGETTRTRGADEGWVSATFARDGRTLLTGKLLCDARDGRLLARLDLDGPGYLEGGPPEHGRQLADDRFVELSPRGVAVWGARDGKRRRTAAGRRYGLMHTIEVSPDARWYVRGRRDGGYHDPVDLCLCRVDDGTVHAELGAADPHTIVFTPDSARLLLVTDGEVVVWQIDTGVRVAVWPHPAAVTGIAVAHDGHLVITGARDGLLRCWDIRRGELRGTRSFITPPEVGQRDTEGPVWRGSASELAELAGWLDFHHSPHRRTTRRRAGLLEIVEADRVIARIASEHDLRADPTGTRWAARPDHYAIVDDG